MNCFKLWCWRGSKPMFAALTPPLVAIPSLSWSDRCAITITLELRASASRHRAWDGSQIGCCAFDDMGGECCLFPIAAATTNPYIYVWLIVSLISWTHCAGVFWTFDRWRSNWTPQSYPDFLYLKESEASYYDRQLLCNMDSVLYHVFFTVSI